MAPGVDVRGGDAERPAGGPGVAVPCAELAATWARFGEPLNASALRGAIASYAEDAEGLLADLQVDSVRTTWGIPSEDGKCPEVALTVSLTSEFVLSGESLAAMQANPAAAVAGLQSGIADGLGVESIAVEITGTDPDLLSSRRLHCFFDRWRRGRR